MRRIVFTLLFLLSCAFGLAQTPTVQSDTKVKGTFEVTGAVKFDGSVCINTNCITIWPTGSGGITQLTGDGLVGPGSGSQALTLATVNSSPGTCGDTTHVCQVTTNNKGLVTAQSAVSITGGGSFNPASPGVIGGTTPNVINGTNGNFSGTFAAPTVVANQFHIPYPSGLSSLLPSSYATDPRFSGLGARKAVTFSLYNYAQSHSYTSYHSAGTSIPFGYSAGGPGTADCTVPWTSATKCYPAIVATSLGISGSAVTVEATAGDSSQDGWWRELNNFTGPSDSMLSINDGQTNDMQGVQRNSSPVSLPIEPDLIQTWMAREEYYSIDPANWYEATGSTCSGGSWTADTYYGTHPGCQSHTINDVLTFPAWQSVTGGEPVTVLYRVYNPNTGNGIVSGTYTSGITAVGTTGQTCNLTTFNNGNAGGTATVALTGTNTIAGGTALVITNTGGGSTSAATSATAINGTATCSGTATVSAPTGTAVKNGATFEVQIGVGSSSSGPFTPAASAIFNTVVTATTLNFINVTGANANSTVFPAVLSNSSVAANPGTGISNSLFIPTLGSWYQVTVTVLSVTNPLNNFTVIGMGTGRGFECTTCNINTDAWPAQEWHTSIPATKDGYQWGIWHQLNNDLDTATLYDQQSGFSVNKLDTLPCESGDPNDFDPTSVHHFNAAGHAKVANCILNNPVTKIPAPTSSSSVTTVNAAGGTFTGTITDTALHIDQTGQLASHFLGGIASTSVLWQCDSTLSIAYPPTSAARFVGCGIAGGGHIHDTKNSYYDGSTVQTQTETETWGSNQSAGVTPTAFTDTFSYTTTAGAVVPVQKAWNGTSGINNNWTINNFHFTSPGNTTYAGFGYGSGVASSPTLRTEGDCWNNNSTHRVTCRINSVDQQEAWVSDIPGVAAAAEVIPLVAFNSTAGSVIPNGSTEMYSYNFPTAINLGHLGVRITTADNTGTNLYDIGVYSLGFGTGTSGSLLAHTGPIAGTTFAPATGFVSEAMTSSVLLVPGTYLIAVTSNCASSCAALAASPNTIGISRFGSTGSGTGGTLPSTIIPASFSPNFSSNIWGMTAFQ